MKYLATQPAIYSNWNFDSPWLEAGETATIIRILVEDRENPFYLMQRDRDGEKKAVHRNRLLDRGEFYCYIQATCGH